MVNVYLYVLALGTENFHGYLVREFVYAIIIFALGIESG